jgi:creatinine amidohydrolase
MEESAPDAAAGGVLYVQKGPATLTEMTGQEVEAAVARMRLILLPVGATEAHGPHLPLGTDTMEAREICRRVALRLAAQGREVVIGPVIPFGASSVHLGFPGTVSISSRTLIALLAEIAASLHRTGFRDFVLVHGHDGNLPSMMVAAQEIVDTLPETRAVVLNWLAPLSRVYHTIQRSTKGEGHGGEGETSRLLVTHPELVHPERGPVHHLPPEVMRKIQGPEHVKTGGGIFYATRSYRDHTPWGHIGDPGLALAETGERGDAVIVDWIASVIARDFFAA